MGVCTPTMRREERPLKPRIVILERGRIGEPWSIQELCDDYKQADQKMLKFALQHEMDWNDNAARYEDSAGLTYITVIGKI